MSSCAKIKVILVGETWIASKFLIKGLDIVPMGGYKDFATWFKDALKPYSDLEITHIPNHIALTSFPNNLFELQKYHVLILSDVGRNSLSFYPDTSKDTMNIDKLKLIQKFVKKGGGLVMCGGWVSFQGFSSMANYHNTPIEEILPVLLSESDDRIESTEGIKPEILDDHHPILNGIPKSEWPLFLGYNRLMLKDKAKLIAKFGNDVFIALGDYENGNTMAFASDLAPHWGRDFIQWKYYPLFWYQCIQWLTQFRHD
jgi:uncharacterized membrane protein